MHVGPLPGKERLVAEEMRKEFNLVEEHGDGSLRAQGPKDKIERFMQRYKNLIDRGLIAAPGSVVQHGDGTRYEVRADGSWKRL